VSLNGGQELLSHEDLPADLIHGAGASKERLQPERRQLYWTCHYPLFSQNAQDPFLLIKQLSK